MRPDLEALLVLQDRDQKIKALQAQQKNFPRDKKVLEDKMASAKVVLEHVRQQVKENEVGRQKIQLEVESKRGSIARFKTQQQQTRKNDEYQALSNEIKHSESDVQALEDRELDLMEQAERLQGGLATAEKDFSKTESTLKEQLSKLESGFGAVADRLKELQENRRQQAAKIDGDLVDLFQRVFAKKGDAAVVPLEHEICGGCSLNVPAQTVAEVRSEVKIAQCPQCGRVLYRVI